MGGCSITLSDRFSRGARCIISLSDRSGRGVWRGATEGGCIISLSDRSRRGICEGSLRLVANNLAERMENLYFNSWIGRIYCIWFNKTSNMCIYFTSFY